MSEIDYIVDDIITDLDDKIEKVETYFSKQHEAGTGSILGIVLSAPFIMKLIGTAIDKGIKFIKEHEDDEETIGQFLIDLSHELHHKLETPLMHVAKMLFKSPSKQRFFVDILFGTILLTLLGQSGLKFVTYARRLKISKSVLYALKGAIKGAELRHIGKNVSKILKKLYANEIH